jgi:hypothetical protein
MPGMGNRRYVIKRGELELEKNYATKKEILDYLKRNALEWDEVKVIQSDASVRAFENGSNASLVEFLLPPEMCRLQKDVIFEAVPSNISGRNVTVPKGSYLCVNESFSEFAIGIYAGQLYHDKVCINFFDVYSQFVCPPKNLKLSSSKKEIFSQYIFMDKLSGDIRNPGTAQHYSVNALGILNIKNETTANSMFAQTLFAIFAYQSTYKISHNVFMEFVTDKTEFNGQKIKGATHFHYHFKGYDIYIPSSDIIIKIGDYGLSIKYSTPIIGKFDSVKDGMNINDGQGAWVPNVFVPSYDSLFFAIAFIMKMSKNEPSLENIGPMIFSCMKFMCPKIENTKIFDYMVHYNYIRESNFRPVLPNLKYIPSALDILKGPIYDAYRVKPSGNIVTLGYIA